MTITANTIPTSKEIFSSGVDLVQAVQSSFSASPSSSSGQSTHRSHNGHQTVGQRLRAVSRDVSIC